MGSLSSDDLVPTAADGLATETTLAGVLTTSDFDTKIGSLTETAPTTDTASSGVNGRLQRIAQRLTSLIALLPAALTGSGNFKVAVVESTAAQAVTNANLDAGLSTLLTTSDFDTKAGSLTEAAPATDTASSGLNGRLQRVAQRLTSLIALHPSALVSGRFDVNVGAAPAAEIGIVTETAPASDTASSGVNGRLQRIAQRLTSLIALLPSALVSNRLDVNIGAAPAVVTVSTTTVVASGTLTRPANTTLYTANDEMTDTTGNVLAISGCARANGGAGYIEAITVIANLAEATAPNLDIFIFDTTSTPAADNAAFAPSDAVMNTCVVAKNLGTRLVGDAATTGNAVFQLSGLRIPFVCGASSTSLFVRFAVRNGFTAGANSSTFFVRLHCLQQ